MEREETHLQLKEMNQQKIKKPATAEHKYWVYDWCIYAKFVEEFNSQLYVTMTAKYY